MASLDQRYRGYNELRDEERASRNMSELLGALFSPCDGVRNSFLFRSAASLRATKTNQPDFSAS